MVALVAVLLIIKTVSEKETYASDDPLYGSFIAENLDTTDEIYPADFLLSIGVDTTDETLVKCAEKNQVDLSKGCWAYSFWENKVFKAEKQGDTLQVYEDGKVIGIFTYASTRFLWFNFNEEYTAEWRGEKYDIVRSLQGFAFP